MKILLATDGSKFSESATQMVSSQFRTKGVQVRVLQVTEPLVFSSPPGMVKQAKDSVGHTAELLRKAGFKVDTRVAENEIRTGILDVATEWHADLIVLGSHGEKGLRRFLLGSVAEFVARHAPCSVLVVRTASNSRS